jgi:hypothetical protein
VCLTFLILNAVAAVAASRLRRLEFRAARKVRLAQGPQNKMELLNDQPGLEEVSDDKQRKGEHAFPGWPSWIIGASFPRNAFGLGCGGDWGSKRGLRCCGSTQEEPPLEDWNTKAKAPRIALEALRRLEGRGQQRLYKGACYPGDLDVCDCLGQWQP